jgi:acetyl-CoA C-acetyltransferase
MGNAYILDTVRTPRGRGKKDAGALSSVHPNQLLGQTLRQLEKRMGVPAGEVDDVVIGCVTQVEEQSGVIARNAVLAAGWPEHVTGVTLNRYCGSGSQAVNFGVMGVMSGQQRLVVAGGVESMSRVPMGTGSGGALDGNDVTLRKTIFQVPQGISADLIATREGFTREDVDRFAAESQRKAEVAQKNGHFAKSIFPVVHPETGAVVLDKDEHPRHGTTVEALAGLKPSFDKLGAMKFGPNGETVDELALKRYPEIKAIQHLHTGGNSSGIVDGAGLVALASDELVKAHGLKPRARIIATATWGDEPVIMLTAPAPASQKALKLAGMSVKDIDLWEINEAFATVPLQTIKKLEIDPAKVNVNGGAIALGHPLGATGAILIGTLLDELERRNLETGLVTLCIGGGMGIATIVQRV